MAKKNTTPTASTKARRGCSVGNRLQSVPVQPGGCCPEEAAGRSRKPELQWEAEHERSCGAGQQCQRHDKPSVDMVYLHKHTGFSILPFLSGSLCLACLPVLLAPQPLSLLLSAGLRAASSPAVRSPCQTLFSPQIKSPLLLPGLITSAHAADPNTSRASPRGRQLRQGHAHVCASPTHAAEDLVLLWSPPSQEKTILQSPALAELAKVQTAYLPAAHLNPSPRLYCALKGPLCSLGQPSSPPPHQEASPPCKHGARGGQDERGDIPKRPGH